MVRRGGLPPPGETEASCKTLFLFLSFSLAGVLQQSWLLRTPLVVPLLHLVLSLRLAPNPTPIFFHASSFSLISRVVQASRDISPRIQCLYVTTAATVRRKRITGGGQYRGGHRGGIRRRRTPLSRGIRGPAAWGGSRRTLPAMQVSERRWRG